MGSIWLSVDNNFPTFLGNENLKDQVRLLHDFLPILIENLKYQLNNLDSSNWNNKAKADFQSETTQELEDAMDVTDEELANLIHELETLQLTVSGLKSRMSDAESDIAWMEQWKTEIQQQADGTEQIAEENSAELDALNQMLIQNEDGSYTIGQDGVSLHLKGQVYLNGVLLG